MLDLIKRLCEIDSAPGNEWATREFIIEQIKDFCEYRVDALGNIIAFKKGEIAPKKRILLDAHTDEVAIIVSSITPDGFLKFHTVGGIKTGTLLARRVNFENGVSGVIGAKPVHLMSDDEAKKLPDTDKLFIDIGSTSRKNAEELISVGDFGVLEGEFILCGDNMLSKALDDRVGCAVLIKLIQDTSKYDFYATFTVQEELGCRGAKTATFAIKPDFAIVLEGTTAADIEGIPFEKSVCSLGGGVAVSFMDNGTMYDRSLYNAAINSGIPAQTKRAVAGANNSAAIHLSGEGVRTIALSVPCRYIHSPSSVANIKDAESSLLLAKHLIELIGGDKID